MNDPIEMNCPDCEGTGENLDDETGSCMTCWGLGTIERFGYVECELSAVLEDVDWN